eukprot:CAMPEP_0197453390 /NCGR_PEP_ID=MMETSP1175-20131217/34795_1 /TAXON_ID=1003142 /ORGANISM="Triceratium dubium, Strain CCMP147" /LENGTH=212 /DNA_ID=CAMNT_0042986667 /DNA_START=105 /DNA_END=743 /DNA_ORIENTATION=+
MQLRLSAILLASVLLASTDAYTAAPQAASSFGGRTLPSPTFAPQQRTTRGDICMKKGKANVPPQMRGQYKKAQEMQNMRQQMMEAQNPGADGLPVFNLYVRTKVANMWYPCGSFKGDDRSAALASNYRDNGLLSGISKKQLDGGVAGSLYRDLDKLKDSVTRGYPQLRKSRDELEFGYKLAYEGLSDDQTKINVVEPKETKGFFDNVKRMFS